MKERRARRAKRVAIIRKVHRFFLLYFIFFTLYFSMMTLAKYTSSSTGTGTASIAIWDVSVDTSDNENNTLNMVIGNTTQSYVLKITSTSETMASYSINLSNLPNEIKVKLDDDDYQIPNNNSITYENVGYINANEDEDSRTITHTLTFQAPIDSNIIDSNEIDIDVIFKQERPNSN